MARVAVHEVEAKTVLVPSRLPDADYVVNPYTGCEFGCVYCYASFMGRFVGQTRDAWGDYVYVKTNTVSRFTAELARWPAHRRQSSILLSSVTDPYHGVEQKYRQTRGVLEVLAAEGYPGHVSILTKSPLVLRDVDVIRRLATHEVGMTVTTTDDRLSRLLEVRAPLASRRLATLKRLADAGITTYAFVGPLLPHFRYQPELLEALFAELARARVGSIYVEHLNVTGALAKVLQRKLRGVPETVRRVYAEAAGEDHRAALDAIVRPLLAGYDLRLRHSKVLYHPS